MDHSLPGSRRCVALVIVLMLLAGCGSAPPAQVAPTAGPAAMPSAAAAVRATTAPPPTALAAPSSAPTSVAATRVPLAETLLPPDPTLAEALQGFEGNALLYTRADRSLMLMDAGKQQLWLTADKRFCGRSNTALSQGGVWSADRRWFALKTYATAERTIAAWSLYRADGTSVRSYSSEPVRSVEDLAWLSDGRLALAVNRVNFGVELVIADTEGKEQVVASRPSAVAHTLAVAPDDALFAIGMANQIVIFDAQGNVRSELDETHQGWWPGYDTRAQV